jgi:hypothetical protein
VSYWQRCWISHEQFRKQRTTSKGILVLLLGLIIIIIIIIIIITTTRCAYQFFNWWTFVSSIIIVCVQQNGLWDFRFSRWRVWRWLSSGLLCRITASTSITRAMTHRPDDGGSKHLWNVGKLLPDNTAQQPRRQPSLERTIGLDNGLVNGGSCTETQSPHFATVTITIAFPTIVILLFSSSPSLLLLYLL